jgi:hypothetical protein
VTAIALIDIGPLDLAAGDEIGDAIKASTSASPSSTKRRWHTLLAASMIQGYPAVQL